MVLRNQARLPMSIVNLKKKHKNTTFFQNQFDALWKRSTLHSACICNSISWNIEESALARDGILNF